MTARATAEAFVHHDVISPAVQRALQTQGPIVCRLEQCFLLAHATADAVITAATHKLLATSARVEQSSVGSTWATDDHRRIDLEVRDEVAHHFVDAIIALAVASDQCEPSQQQSIRPAETLQTAASRSPDQTQCLQLPTTVDTSEPRQPHSDADDQHAGQDSVLPKAVPTALDHDTKLQDAPKIPAFAARPPCISIEPVSSTVSNAESHSASPMARQVARHLILRKVVPTALAHAVDSPSFSACSTELPSSAADALTALPIGHAPRDEATATIDPQEPPSFQAVDYAARHLVLLKVVPTALDRAVKAQVRSAFPSPAITDPRKLPISGQVNYVARHLVLLRVVPAALDRAAKARSPVASTVATTTTETPTIARVTPIQPRASSGIAAATELQPQSDLTFIHPTAQHFVHRKVIPTALAHAVAKSCPSRRPSPPPTASVHFAESTSSTDDEQNNQPVPDILPEAANCQPSRAEEAEEATKCQESAEPFVTCVSIEDVQDASLAPEVAADDQQPSESPSTPVSEADESQSAPQSEIAQPAVVLTPLTPTPPRRRTPPTTTNDYAAIDVNAIEATTTDEVQASQPAATRPTSPLAPVLPPLKLSKTPHDKSRQPHQSRKVLPPVDRGALSPCKSAPDSGRRPQMSPDPVSSAVSPRPAPVLKELTILSSARAAAAIYQPPQTTQSPPKSRRQADIDKNEDESIAKPKSPKPHISNKQRLEPHKQGTNTQLPPAAAPPSPLRIASSNTTMMDATQSNGTRKSPPKHHRTNGESKSPKKRSGYCQRCVFEGRSCKIADCLKHQLLR